MTNKDYLKQKFASLGLSFSEADLLDMQIENADAEADQSTYRAFISYIPQLLLRPQSVSEGGTSISRANAEEIKNFYKNECKRLGIADVLQEKRPKVRFR